MREIVAEGLRLFELFRPGPRDAGLEGGALHRLRHVGVHVAVEDRGDELPGGCAGTDDLRGGDLHPVVDLAGPRVQRAPEHPGERKGVVDPPAVRGERSPPRPTIPTVSFFTCSPTYLLAFSSDARTTTAVPCWSSCITGMSSIPLRRSSISKHSGALMSSSLIAPNVRAIEATVRMIYSVSFDWMRMGMPLIPTSASKRAAFPSITGMPATAPMSPSPRMAVPLVTIATELGMTV